MSLSEKLNAPPSLNASCDENLSITRLGIVSRNYNTLNANGCRDFSQCFNDVVSLLDREGCNFIMFSLYSVVKRDGFSVLSALNNLTLKHVKCILLEEYDETVIDGMISRHNTKKFLYNKIASSWQKCRLNQIFGTSKEASDIANDNIVNNLKLNRFQKLTNGEFLVRHVFPLQRIYGNFCILFCGEINSVKYDRIKNKVVDNYGLLRDITTNNTIKIILNPVHDKMQHSSFRKKRIFLSAKGLYVVSIWNKGRIFRNGKELDGLAHPWQVYHNQEPYPVRAIVNNFDIEIGIVDFN